MPPEDKINAIKRSFSPLLGDCIDRLETAELLHDGLWDEWADLPVRIFTRESGVVSISWSRFDDLWLTNDLTLPFDTGDSAIRWELNRYDAFRDLVGRRITRVWLGRGQMTWDDDDVEIWTRLLIELDGLWLEVFNALDENGYQLHSHFPAGSFVSCVSVS